MDNKTLATIIVVFLSVLLIPMAIGIIGSVFGIVGDIAGAFFSIVGAIFGAVFSFIGALFGWLFYGHFEWHWPFHFFSWDLFTVAALVLLVVVLTRSKNVRPQRGSQTRR